LDEFLIPDSSGGGSLVFFGRMPVDRTQPLKVFGVRLTVDNLSAVAQVYADYASSHPAHLFTEMARQWTGWQGELSWESLEHELILRCSHDRFGHILIRVGLQSGFMPDDWKVEATVVSEAGQLDRLARHAAGFFGKGGSPGF
jgi:hypothetical protein